MSSEAERMIGFLADRITTYSRLIELIQKLGDPPTFFGYAVSSNNLLLVVNSLDSLHKVRKWLREKLGTWEDKKESIWYSSGDMIVSYKSENSDIVIWLETKPEDFPKELQSEKCKVVRLADEVVPRYAYVCENKEG